MIARFPSIAALGAAHGTETRWLNDHSMARQTGTTASEVLDRCRVGDWALVPNAEKLIDKFSVDLEAPSREIISDVAGGWPCVPDVLAGHPDCMRRRAAVESDVSPLAIWACVSASWQLTRQDLAARGTAILALVLALSRVRPIELHIFGIDSLNGKRTESVIEAPVNTTPLDIATAAFALTSAGFYRRVVFGLARKLHCTDGKWPKAYLDDQRGYLASIVAKLDGRPDVDLIIDGARAFDPLIGDPLAWVRAQLAHYVGAPS